MTTAENVPDPRQLLAERFGEELIPLDLPAIDADAHRARVEFADALHAAAGWIMAHPEIPVPSTVSMNSYTDAEGLAAAAELLDEKIYGAQQRQIDHELVPGAPIRIYVANILNRDRAL